MSNEKFYVIINETTGKEIAVRNNFTEIFDVIYDCCYDFLQSCDDWQSIDCPEIDIARVENQVLWLAAQIVRHRSGGDVCSICTAKIEKGKFVL